MFDLYTYILLTKREGRTGRNISPRSFLYGPRCARSVLSRPRADILPVRPSRLVNKIYLLLTRIPVARPQQGLSSSASLFCFSIAVCVLSRVSE